MKNLILPIFFILGCQYGFTNNVDKFFVEANQFLKEHVKNGYINYQAIHEDPAALNNLTDKISKINPDQLSGDSEKAFLINAYNILVIKQIISHYPVQSPMAVEGFFNNIKHQVGTKKVTLDELEKGILLKKYPDSRVHFAVVCAAKGCPKIPDFAFQPQQLDQQLQKVTSSALSDPEFIRVDEEKGRAYLSKIFEWYAQDFTKENASLVSYINQFRDKKIPESYKVRFYEYDWSLNDIS